MKGLLLLVVTCALLVPGGAYARDWRSGFGALVQAQDPPKKKGPERIQRGDQNKRGVQEKRNRGRLTQEERRELHRDLDRANREIYRR